MQSSICIVGVIHSSLPRLSLCLEKFEVQSKGELMTQEVGGEAVVGGAKGVEVQSSEA